AAAGPRIHRAARGDRAERSHAALVVPAPGRAVPLRPVARGREPREPAFERADRRDARNARSHGNREGGAPPNLREGRPLRSAVTRETPGALPGRAPARLGLTYCAGEPWFPRDPLRYRGP